MTEEVKVPEVGESITEGILALWNKKDGDFVERDEQLFELETDKVTMPVNSTFEGRISIRVAEGEKVKIGQVVAAIDTSASRAAAAPAPSKAVEVKKPATPPAVVAESPRAGAEPEAGEEKLTPSAQRLIEEHSIDLKDIRGTGKGGRIIKEDVLRFLEDSKSAMDVESRKPDTGETRAASSREEKTEEAFASRATGNRRQTRRPMSPLRQRVAKRLVEAQQNAAMVSTYNEADMTEILRLRERYSPLYEKRYGIKLGFMSFFIKAAVDALKTVPSVNAWIDGEDIVQNHFYDIGIAVSTDKGLVVPILRDCDTRSLPELEQEVIDYATKARERKLTLDDLSGGSFSISNGGVFGSLLSAPMLNPPQSGILGMHAIKKRPVVIEDRIEIRPMMYLALTYDHRLVDGREGVTFLKRIVECIENPERMILEV